MTSLLSVYEEGCRTSRVTPNSALHSYFATRSSDEPLHIFSLSSNQVGPRGLRALLPVWLLCRHTLHTLDLSRNNLGNGAISQLTRWLATTSDDGFPALRRLELCGNPFTYQAGKCLVHCCEGLRPSTGTLSARSAAPPTSDGATPASTLGNEEFAAAAAAGDSSCYWEEVPGMQIEYVGVADTSMPSGLQRALHTRIAEAIVRREQRRRRHCAAPHRPSQRQRSFGAHRSHRSSKAADDEARPNEESSAAAPVEAAVVRIPADLFDELADELAEVDGREEEAFDEGVAPTNAPAAATAAEADNKIQDNELDAVNNINIRDDVRRSLPRDISSVRGHGATHLPVTEVLDGEREAPTLTITSSSLSPSYARGDAEAALRHISGSATVPPADMTHVALLPPSELYKSVNSEYDDELDGADAEVRDGASFSCSQRNAEDAFTCESHSPPFLPTTSRVQVETPTQPQSAADVLDGLGMEARAGSASYDAGASNAAPSWLDDM
ncbi:hypothetical protein ABB37_06444 [Leptomonas pyrrhocoris]|uniref:Leucine-rich repeat protein n=1 Tax=Leptomonas pyrrhocoris TaxID=157538 RepID=A0A0M9FY39_LEPPY|nr:hypothetical protein ABB37_06444 [Leptomonas pyrrhocoris]KPA78307.1 hypothetical protein ABB37_06444 [Leptomonas pyrrhocoris]|eukprot:XP_015656746.1 hypothetical protein ABB37_06444 [Leptomonas pyrrhocoris]